ncbi:hypothetical protein KCU96_g47, partial [Aureobasidium melanogenum]
MALDVLSSSANAKAAIVSARAHFFPCPVHCSTSNRAKENTRNEQTGRQLVLLSIVLGVELRPSRFQHAGCILTAGDEHGSEDVGHIDVGADHTSTDGASLASNDSLVDSSGRTA